MNWNRRLIFHLGDESFEFVEFFAGPVQQCGLRIEFFAGHEIHARKRRFEHQPYIIAHLGLYLSAAARQYSGDVFDEVFDLFQFDQFECSMVR